MSSHSAGEGSLSTMTGASMPAARRAAPSPAMATASDAAPLASAVRATSTAPCP
jgi:hypothetical protein